HIGMAWVDPDALVVVAAWCALEGRPRASAVFGLVRSGACREYDVRILWMHSDVDVEPRVRAHQPPRRTRVVRSIHATTLARRNDRVEAARIAVRYREVDPAESAR